MLIYAVESCKLLMAVFFPSVHNPTVVVNGRLNNGTTPTDSYYGDMITALLHVLEVAYLKQVLSRA